MKQEALCVLPNASSSSAILLIKESPKSVRPIRRLWIRVHNFAIHCLNCMCTRNTHKHTASCIICQCIIEAVIYFDSRNTTMLWKNTKIKIEILGSRLEICFLSSAKTSAQPRCIHWVEPNSIGPVDQESCPILEHTTKNVAQTNVHFHMLISGAIPLWVMVRPPLSFTLLESNLITAFVS